MLRRACLVTLLLATVAPAMAQAGQGTIFYDSGSLYGVGVGGDGDGQALSMPSKTIPGAPSARSDYPGGRISPSIVSLGNISGTDPSRRFIYGNIWAQFEDGSSKRLVHFANPDTGSLYVITFFTQNLWSNDGQDRFFSFWPTTTRPASTTSSAPTSRATRSPRPTSSPWSRGTRVWR